jgi:hypothetical protein
MVTRVEQLRATGCDVAMGTDSAVGVVAHWHIERGSRYSVFRDSAEIHDSPAGVTHRERVYAAVIC